MTARTQDETFVPAGEARASAALTALTPSRARELALVYRALADPTRVQIVSMLLGAGESGLCVCDIVPNFPLGQPTISHHLKVLKDTGLLKPWKRGLWVHYTVNRERLSRLGISLPVLHPSLTQPQMCGPLDGNDLQEAGGAGV